MSKSPVAGSGPVGTISLMGRLGQLSACAEAAIAKARQHSAMRMNRLISGGIVSSQTYYRSQLQ
jgi:hypothetical protein